MIRRRLALVALLVASLGAGCSSDEPATSGADTTATPDVGGDVAGPPEDTAETDTQHADTADTTEPLAADAGSNRYAVVGETITLDGSASTGALTYEWHPGAGAALPAGDSPTAEVSYDAPGRYKAVLTVRNALGQKKTAQVTISVTWPRIFDPAASSSVLALSETLGAAVSPDGNAVVYFSLDPPLPLATRPVPGGPRQLAPKDDGVVVTCPDADAVRFVPQTGEVTSWSAPPGARPFGITRLGDVHWVTYQGLGAIARLDADGLGTPVAGFPDARGISALPDGILAISRWRSDDKRAEIRLYNPSSGEITLLPLKVDPQAASDTEVGGVPTYLGPLITSPTGREAVVPSLQANIIQGEFVNGVPLLPDQTIRAVVSFVDVEAGAEQFERRKQFDNRGFANAAVWSQRGDYLYVAMRGSRAIERFDVLTGAQAGTILNVGYAPQGLSITADDRYLLVDASLSREVVIYDVSNFQGQLEPVARIPLVDVEPLSPTLLRGKQLFNDSFDLRLSKDGYMACAHCHLDGDSDHRTWDFTDRGEGLRNTHSLLGHAGLGDGPLHWSANFDEVQDFEHDIRGPFGGQGLMDDAAFESTNSTLGAPKAGLSDDLDALAAYVASLSTPLVSPHRESNGDLTSQAEAGRLLFEADHTGCTACHSGPRLTDSQFLEDGSPLLHDVGTLHEGSGSRLGEPLTGLDTPTLHGVWHSAPYLHDGSAPTLEAVLTTFNAGDQHGATSHLTDGELQQLVAYLMSLDGRVD